MWERIGKTMVFDVAICSTSTNGYGAFRGGMENSCFTTAAERAIILLFTMNGNVLPEPDAESRVAGVNADRQVGPLAPE